MHSTSPYLESFMKLLTLALAVLVAGCFFFLPPSHKKVYVVVVTSPLDEIKVSSNP